MVAGDRVGGGAWFSRDPHPPPLRLGLCFTPASPSLIDSTRPEYWCFSRSSEKRPGASVCEHALGENQEGPRASLRGSPDPKRPEGATGSKRSPPPHGQGSAVSLRPEWPRGRPAQAALPGGPWSGWPRVDCRAWHPGPYLAICKAQSHGRQRWHRPAKKTRLCDSCRCAQLDGTPDLWGQHRRPQVGAKTARS